MQDLRFQQLFVLDTAIKKETLEADSVPFEQFLQKLVADQNTSLARKRIHINWHFTDVNFLLLRALIRAGAHVTVSAIDGLVCHDKLLSYLIDAQIPYFTSLAKIQEYYADNPCDIYFDCGAKLLGKIDPTYFGMELTHTDPDLYKDIDYPVINLDSSLAKSCETRAGTGDGFCRALIDMVLKGKHQPQFLSEVLQKEKLAPLNVNITLDQFPDNKRPEIIRKALTKEEYIIFGYGKVGTGICNALLKMGVPADKITVIDTNKAALTKAHAKEFKTHFLDENNPGAVKRVLKAKAANVIGATGRPGSIAKIFSLNDFHDKSHFVNMSTEDDFGHKFPTERFVGGRREIFNFCLDRPTKFEYLAPPFGVALFCMIQMLLRREMLPMSNGLCDTSRGDSIHVLNTWAEVYSREFSELLTDKEFSESFKQLRSPPTSPRKGDRCKSVAHISFHQNQKPENAPKPPRTPPSTGKRSYDLINNSNSLSVKNSDVQPPSGILELDMDEEIEDSTLVRTSSNQPLPFGSRPSSPDSGRFGLGRQSPKAVKVDHAVPINNPAKGRISPQNKK